MLLIKISVKVYNKYRASCMEKVIRPWIDRSGGSVKI